MQSVPGRGRNVGAALLVVLVAGILGVLATRGGLGQQADVSRSGGGDVAVLRGKYYVQLQTREGFSTFEDVRRVVLKPDWAILELTQDDQSTTLILPREAVTFIKSWENDEEEKK